MAWIQHTQFRVRGWCRHRLVFACSVSFLTRFKSGRTPVSGSANFKVGRFSLVQLAYVALYALLQLQVVTSMLIKICPP